MALDLPMAQLGAAWFDYRLPSGQTSVGPGTWVIVPWGRGRRIGLVLELADRSELAAERIRSIDAPLADAPPAPVEWLRLVRFAADYYHRGAGEVALPAVPKLLRTPPSARARGSVFERARRRFDAVSGTASAGTPGADAPGVVTSGVATPGADAPGVGTQWSDTSIVGETGRSDHACANSREPSPAQRDALAALSSASGYSVSLLHGVTGSGKTEVYLQWLSDFLAGDERAQVLLLVPEIALTPQLAGQLASRFPAEPVAVLHSDLADGDRAAHWLAAVDGRARVVVGTRLAVLAPLPRLAAIVVDEEHDPSYKQQEGVRYSARDLAIVAASQRGIPIVLGSATPSLESWLSARRQRYRLLRLPDRIGGAALPTPQTLDLRGKTLRHDLAPAAVEAIGETLARGEQALVFINRRGYSPVLGCQQCGWLSRCTDCSAYRVMHRIGPARTAAANRYRLVCHHCGGEQPVPRSCPDCGNIDVQAIGRGTQRLEEGLAELFPGARIGRLDRDVASRRGAARQVLDSAHAGELDILVGTQMLAKGHDFRRLSLVVAVDCDGGLYAADYRAPERLFATLMQVAGRAGRDARASRVLLQTRFPEHPLFAFLSRHDYDGFADWQLAERQQAGLPPWRHQALLRAEGSTQADALAFLTAARDRGQALLDADSHFDTQARPAVLDPVPMAMSRLAGRERAQLLVECATRSPLHRFLDLWLPGLREIAGNVHWALDVDPSEI